MELQGSLHDRQIRVLRVNEGISDDLEGGVLVAGRVVETGLVLDDVLDYVFVSEDVGLGGGSANYETGCGLVAAVGLSDGEADGDVGEGFFVVEHDFVLFECLYVWEVRNFDGIVSEGWKPL